MSPRYDLPKAAPEPLRRVQLFLNTVNHENGDDWLASWLAEHAPPADERRARRLREALRALVLGNNGIAVPEEALQVLNAEVRRLRLELDGAGRPHVRGEDPLADVLAVALAAMLDGTFARLKACRNCHWSFYDYSPNRSATWCSMQLCGNRRKTRTYRRRRATRAGEKNVPSVAPPASPVEVGTPWAVFRRGRHARPGPSPFPPRGGQTRSSRQRSAFCTWSRFSASSQIAERGP